METVRCEKCGQKIEITWKEWIENDHNLCQKHEGK